MGNPSRRRVVEIGCRTLALAGLTGSAGVASGRSRPDGILISLHLMGGNDGHNLMVPLEGAQYRAYAAARPDLAISARELLPLKPSGSEPEFGFHPELKELRDLYQSGGLSVIANIGPAARPQGHACESLAFLRGGFVTPAFAARQGGLEITSESGFVTGAHGVSMVPVDGYGVSAETREGVNRLSARTPYNRFPSTPLGRGFAQIAALIPETSGRRVVFSVPMSGFDTHRDQLRRQAELFRELSQAMSAFFRESERMREAERIVVYTDSEFGRSLHANGLGGSEHGWGNHHLVMGAALGGRIHGDFPDLRSIGTDGALRPRAQTEDFLAALSGSAGFASSVLFS